MEEKGEFPMRINKYLAKRGISTRRDADALIERGIVEINGRRAKLGDKVVEKDVVTIKGIERKKYFYLAYHKPQGTLSHGAAEDEREIPTKISIGGQRITVFPIGRLDKDSSGLIILTNDGRVTDRLLNPEYEHEKTYHVTLDKAVSNHLIKWIREGVRIEDYTTKPASARQTGASEIEITLTEGKKHQIRRMCAALGFQVKKLVRTRIENIELENLRAGAYREFTPSEREEFLNNLGL